MDHAWSPCLASVQVFLCIAVQTGKLEVYAIRLESFSMTEFDEAGLAEVAFDSEWQIEPPDDTISHHLFDSPAEVAELDESDADLWRRAALSVSTTYRISSNGSWFPAWYMSRLEIKVASTKGRFFHPCLSST
ncbi:unnamed protein product [Symbiodinium natans]|uniref:Uncharacterized protein n=1 Tax=Symbiodinium natans TaxID=878477 RepID=A0A812TAJ9_9DINO|nr:unnamed protein product [Symbiodinium natans]